MSDYTPSTEFLRRMYATDTQAHEPFDYRLAEFDRWLAAHDAEVYRRGREDAAKDVRDRGFALWSHRPDERRISAGVLPALMAAARGDGEQ